MRNKQEKISILKIHESKMNEFSPAVKKKKINQLNVLINKKTEEIINLKKEINVKEINGMNYDDINIKIYKLEQEKTKLIDNIKSLETNDLETNYLLNTYELINDYIECNELEKNLMVSTDDVEQDLFELNKKKNKIIHEYMKIVEPGYVNLRHIEHANIYCDVCNTLLIIRDGYSVCYECGKTYKSLHFSEELGFKELQNIDYRPQFTYEKMTHLEDWLRRFQAKENKHIPQDILDKVILEAHKQRVRDLSTLTELQVKKYLKKLQLNDYYDNVISIINRINKRPPFVLTTEVETKIKEMFQQIQEPFEKYKDPNRKNMLSYSYLLHHFFLILGLPEFSKYFFLLKSPDKLRQQDQTFKKIVEELAKTDSKTPWKFYPSI